MSKTANGRPEMNPKAIAIGARIRERRVDRGLTQAQLAAKVGVTENAITQYETGRAVPKPQRLQGIATALGSSMEWLLTGGEEEEIVRAQTTSELHLLREFRSIPVEMQDAALAAIQGMKARFEKK